MLLLGNFFEPRPMPQNLTHIGHGGEDAAESLLPKSALNKRNQSRTTRSMHFSPQVPRRLETTRVEAEKLERFLERAGRELPI